MKVFAIGITKNEGVSKKSDPAGKAYKMAALLVLQPIENASGDSKDGGKWSRFGFGFQVAEFQADPNCLEQFRDIKFPCTLEVLTDTQQQFGRMQTVVVGCSQDKTLKAAA